MASTSTEIEVDGRTLRISSPEKPYLAELGVDKLGVVDYFRSVGPGILAALKDRPTTMERLAGRHPRGRGDGHPRGRQG